MRLAGTLGTINYYFLWEIDMSLIVHGSTAPTSRLPLWQVADTKPTLDEISSSLDDSIAELHPQIVLHFGSNQVQRALLSSAISSTGRIVEEVDEADKLLKLIASKDYDLLVFNYLGQSNLYKDEVTEIVGRVKNIKLNLKVLLVWSRSINIANIDNADEIFPADPSHNKDDFFSVLDRKLGPVNREIAYSPNVVLSVGEYTNLVRELREKQDSYTERDDYMKVDRILRKYGNYLRLKYSDYFKCALWHVLFGSTVSADMLLIDFPSPDSLREFIKKL